MELKQGSHHKEVIYHNGGFGLSPKCIEESMKDWKQMNYIIQFVFLKDHPCLCLKF